MSQSQEALGKYTNAYKNLVAFQNENKEVFARNGALNKALMDAENELRDNVSLELEEVSDQEFDVKVFPVTQKVYIDEVILTKFENLDNVVTEVSRPPRITISKK